MIIRKVITHVLDKSVDTPILSEVEQAITPEIDVFYQKILRKIFRDDDLRLAKFSDYNNNIVRVSTDHVIYDDKAFITASQSIAACLFNVMKANSELDSCDLAVVSFTYKDVNQAAVVMLDYKSLYNHSIDVVDDCVQVKLIGNDMGIQAGSRIRNAIIVEPSGVNDEWQLRILDKQGERQERDTAFVTGFVNAKKVLDERYMTKMFVRVSEGFIQNTYGTEPKVIEDTLSALYYNVKEGQEIDLEFMANELFGGDDYRKTLYKGIFKERGITNFAIDESWVKKKLKRRKLQTNTKIKISGLAEDFEDPAKFRMVKNENGTVDLHIRNVEFIEI